MAITNTSIILNENWNLLKKRVIIPLWNGKFKSMYENVKLDYDDFESLAGLELSKAVKTFNPDKSSLLTFATRVITQKAYTELRDCTQRDKRKALYSADSIEASESEVYHAKEEEQDDSEFSELRTGNFVNSLNNNQLRVLILTLLDFSIKDIPKMLNVSEASVRDIVRSLRTTDVTRILYRRNF